MAEVLIRAELEQAGLADRVSVESAGTGDWHIGHQMDGRARAELSRRGHDGASHRARQIDAGWLNEFDLLLTMDAANLRNLDRMARGVPGLTGRIRMFRSFDPAAPAGAQVPDPYGGGPGEFAAVYDLLQAAAAALVAQLGVLLAKPDGA